MRRLQVGGRRSLGGCRAIRNLSGGSGLSVHLGVQHMTVTLLLLLRELGSEVRRWRKNRERGYSLIQATYG